MQLSFLAVKYFINKLSIYLVFITMQTKLVFIWEALHLASLSYLSNNTNKKSESFQIPLFTNFIAQKFIQVGTNDSQA